MTRSTRPVGRPKDPALAAMVNKFLKAAPGNSFFLQGSNRRDLEFFRRAVKRSGVGITIVEVHKDLIHGKPGVRFWREAGPYDDEI